MTQIRVLSESDVGGLLDQIDAGAIVQLMADTFCTVTMHQDQVQTPQRIGITADSHKVLFMPARLNSTTSVKLVSVPTSESKNGLPATVLVIDNVTGNVESILNARALTAVRTAAGSAVATRYYAKEDSKYLVVLGAGAQARSHVDMMIAVRPTLEKIAIWNRTKERCITLVNDLQGSYPDKEFTVINSDDLGSKVGEADIVCTCTNSKEPVLKGEWLKDGVHLNCVGSYTLDMHEVDEQTIKRAKYILVDSVEACSHEAGELVKSSLPSQWTEIGSVVSAMKHSEHGQQTKLGQSSITLFKSVGISAQDSAIAHYLVDCAKMHDVGTLVPF